MANVEVLSVELQNGSLLDPQAFPVALGDINPESFAVLRARFSGPALIMPRPKIRRIRSGSGHRRTQRTHSRRVFARAKSGGPAIAGPLTCRRPLAQQPPCASFALCLMSIALPGMSHGSPPAAQSVDPELSDLLKETGIPGIAFSLCHFPFKLSDFRLKMSITENHARWPITVRIRAPTYCS